MPKVNNVFFCSFDFRVKPKTVHKQEFRFGRYIMRLAYNVEAKVRVYEAEYEAKRNNKSSWLFDFAPT